MQLPAWTVEFYVDARGRMPVLEFIESLQQREVSAVLRAIDLLEEFGPMLTMPHARPIEGGLWELRAGASRVFYFAHVKRRLVLLHAYRKKGQKTPRHEIETAWRRWADLKERER